MVLDPLLKSEKFQDCSICDDFVKVCVIKEVSSIGQGDSASVCAVFFDTLIHCKEVACGLGHFFAVKHKVAIAEIALDHIFRVLPHRLVIIKCKGEVVADQIFSRNTHVHRIPVIELMSKGF